MPRSNSFRVGKVTGYLRGRVWYLCYFEHGQPPPAPRRPRPRRRPATRRPGQRPTRNRRPVRPQLRADRRCRTAGPLARTPRTGSAVRRSSRSTATAPPPTTCSGSSTGARSGTPGSSPPTHAAEFVRYLRSRPGLPERAPEHPQAAAAGQGRAVRAGVLPGAVQLRRPAPAPAAVRREPVRRDRDRPHPRRDGPADRAPHPGPGARLPRGVRRLAVPGVPDPAPDRAAAGRAVPPAPARRPRPGGRVCSGCGTSPGSAGR